LEGQEGKKRLGDLVLNDFVTYIATSSFSLRLLHLARARLAEQPDSDEDQEARHGSPDASNPWIRAADDKTSRPLVVRKMSHSHRPLLVDIAQKWTLVVDDEVEDAVLIWQCESCAEDGAVGSSRGWLK